MDAAAGAAIGAIGGPLGMLIGGAIGAIAGGAAGHAAGEAIDQPLKMLIGTIPIHEQLIIKMVMIIPLTINQLMPSAMQTRKIPSWYNV